MSQTKMLCLFISFSFTVRFLFFSCLFPSIFICLCLFLQLPLYSSSFSFLLEFILLLRLFCILLIHVYSFPVIHCFSSCLLFSLSDYLSPFLPPFSLLVISFPFSKPVSEKYNFIHPTALGAENICRWQTDRVLMKFLDSQFSQSSCYFLSLQNLFSDTLHLTVTCCSNLSIYNGAPS
jgi:hypothetical protein